MRPGKPADILPLHRPDRPGHLAVRGRQVTSSGSHRAGEITGPAGPGPLTYSVPLSGPDDMAGSHPRIVTFPQARSPDGRRKMAWPGLPRASAPASWRGTGGESVTGGDNRTNANARLIHATGPAAHFPPERVPNKVPAVPLFSVIVTERACAGRCCHDVAETGPASRRCARPPGKPAGAGRRPVPGRSQTARVTAAAPVPGCIPCCAGRWRRDTTGRTWPPRPGTGARPGGWRDDRGLARALPGPGAGPGTRA